MTQIIYILAIISLFIVGLNLLPNISSFPTIQTAVNLIAGYMKAWNFLLPIDVLFVITGIITTLEIGIWLFKVLRWVLGYLRGHE